jgi:hypothetical protein
VTEAATTVTEAKATRANSSKIAMANIEPIPFEAVEGTGESRPAFPLSVMFPICSSLSSALCAGSVWLFAQLVLDFPVRCR